MVSAFKFDFSSAVEGGGGRGGKGGLGILKNRIRYLKFQERVDIYRLL